MGKMIVELDTHEEQFEIKLTLNAMEMWSDLLEIDGQCRNRMKHSDDVTDAEYYFLDRIREITSRWPELEH